MRKTAVVTRHPAKLDDLTARGADVRAGDFDDPTSLEAAFAGGERLLLISTGAVGRRIAQHRAAIDAAVAASIPHVLYTSITNPISENPAGVVTEHRATEDALRASGLAWTFLRNGLYAETRATEFAGAAATGIYAHNQGDGRTAPVSREDCAAVAAAGLVEHGVPEQAAPLYASFGRAIREGHLSQHTDVVQTLTDRPPRTLRDTLEALRAIQA